MSGKQLPDIKQLPAGLLFHQFKAQYQALLGNAVHPREAFNSWYSSYCIHHKRKSQTS